MFTFVTSIELLYKTIINIQKQVMDLLPFIEYLPTNAFNIDCCAFRFVCFAIIAVILTYSQQSVFIRMQLLSDNAIIHISAGFQGPFILQAFSIRHDLYKRGVLNFCVTDGTIYIGAKYQYQEDLQLDNYNLIQITAKFQDRFHPIFIKTLDIVSINIKKLVGNPPCTLQDYFNRQTKSNGLESIPRKRIKVNQQGTPQPIRKDIDHHKKPANTPSRQITILARQQIPQQKKIGVINLQSQDKRLLRLASESQDQSFHRPQVILSVDESKSMSKNSPIVQKQQQRFKSIDKTCYIKDLYERSTGWVILCRVNYMSIVQCQNGLFAANFILVDQAESEIKCVYFVSDMDQAKQALAIGNCYLFTGGQVKFSNKEKELQITFDRNSDIIPQRNDIFHSTAAKFIRIDRILDKEHGNIINVLGAVRKIKTKEHLKSKTKYTATLCDPLKHIEIDFMLFLNNQQKEIKVGMVIILHNFQIFKQQNIFRLNSTYKSYYFEEKGAQNHGDIISQFHQIIELTDWQSQHFKNISMFAFTQRTIHDLREICKRTDDERLYSSLDVWALDIARKKSYQACKNCKRPAEKKEMNLYQCVYCKRIVETILTHALCVTFADFTGSCSIDVIGEHAENLLSIKAGQFNSLSPDEQNNHLESLKYKNITLRLKSQKKGDKRQSHSVWGIQKPNPQITLRQIRKQMQINRLKQQQQW